MEFNGKLICYSLSNSQGLSAEGRFLLLCLLYEYSVENKEIDIGVDRLVDTYGITRTVCSQVSKFLSSPANEIAKIRRKETNVCEFDSASLSKLSSDFSGGKQGDYHRDVVISLLSIKSQESDIKLRISNLLLLIILLVHADKSGSVKGVSKAKLRKLMGGISGDRLKSQLNTLAINYYILATSQGGSGRKLFGKVPSSYLLNLGILQKFEHQVDEVRLFNECSVIYSLSKTVRELHQLRRAYESKGNNWDFKVKDRYKKWKSLAQLFGDDLRVDMNIINLVLNKCEIIASTILTEYWCEVETMDINASDFIDLPIFQSLLTREGLFSVSYFEKSESYKFIVSEEGDSSYASRKARKDQYRKEVIVTNQSYQQWLNGNIDADIIIREAHLLTEFLLEQSLAIAKRIKELLPNQALIKPEHVNLLFGQVTVNGFDKDRYVLLMSLTGAEQDDSYSIETLEIDRNEHCHVISIKRY